MKWIIKLTFFPSLLSFHRISSYLALIREFDHLFAPISTSIPTIHCTGAVVWVFKLFQNQKIFQLFLSLDQFIWYITETNITLDQLFIICSGNWWSWFLATNNNDQSHNQISNTEPPVDFEIIQYDIKWRKTYWQMLCSTLFHQMES